MRALVVDHLSVDHQVITPCRMQPRLRERSTTMRIVSPMNLAVKLRPSMKRTSLSLGVVSTFPWRAARLVTDHDGAVVVSFERYSEAVVRDVWLQRRRARTCSRGRCCSSIPHLFDW